MPAQKSAAAARTWSSTLTVLAVVVAVLSAIFYYLDSHLEWFYILDTTHLNDLSQRAIAAHGNDTRSVVEFIVSELSQKLPGGYINLDEEWIFNNAGGAMGAMYIIHASESLNLLPLLLPCLRKRGIVT
jgi:C-8 sterol isomerase